MTTRTWVNGAAGSWNTAADWSPASVPGAADDVVLGVGANVGIYASSVQAGSVSLTDPTAELSIGVGLSLSAPGGLTLAAGTLTVMGTLTNTVLRLQGGTLADSGGGVLDNVTTLGTLDFSALYSGFSVEHALTLVPAAGQPGLRLTGTGSGLAVRNAPATLDGGIALAGSSDASRPTIIYADSGADTLTLAPGLTLDVTGAANLLASTINAGTINVGPGASLMANGSVSGTGAIHIASGTLDLDATTSLSLSAPIQMDDGAATLVLGTGQTATIQGFRAGDTLDINDHERPYASRVNYSGTFQANLSSDQLQVAQGGRAVASVTLAGQQKPGATYAAVSDGTGGILVTTTAQLTAAVAFADQTTGAKGSHAMDAASGGPSYLQWQYLDTGADTVAMTASLPNVFLKGGSGTKALAASSGQNVLDGGTGSSFLTGGSGADTFFVDVRGSNQVWDTLTNFHAGDAVTIWGWTPGSGTETVDAQAGAAGYQGATFRLAAGTGGPTSSLTFAGLSPAQAARLQTATGTAGGIPYLYLYNPGV